MSRLHQPCAHGPPPTPLPALAYAEHRPGTPSPLCPPHLASADDVFFSWQHIWAFFMRAPRVRAWLFEKAPPPAAHVVQSLLSSPMLIGYVFGSSNEWLRDYTFPDIGDLQTVFCRDGDAFLGFHFGFQGIQPIMPLLFQVMRDPMLGNPAVIVRRTARQRAPYPYHNYYLAIEFNWYESGCLGVVTSVSPVDPDETAPTGLCSHLLCVEHRVFTRRTTTRLHGISEALAKEVDMACFPQPTHFVALPQDFLDPGDDYYSLAVCEPDDPEYLSTRLFPHVSDADRTQTFNVEKDFALPSQSTIASTTTADSMTTATTETTVVTSNTANSMPTTSTRTGTDGSSAVQQNGVSAEYRHGTLEKYHRGGADVNCNRGDVAAILEEGTLALWRSYQRIVSQSRRTGRMLTMLSVKKGGRDAKAVPVFGREVSYVFLSTCGIKVHGRIQQLCSQLNIQVASPRTGRVLTSGADMKEMGRRAVSDGKRGWSEIRGKLLVEDGNFVVEHTRTSDNSGAKTTGRRRDYGKTLSITDQNMDLENGWPFVPGKRCEMPPKAPRGDFVMDVCHGSVSSRIDRFRYTLDGMGGNTAHRVNKPKRRRFVCGKEPWKASAELNTSSLIESREQCRAGGSLDGENCDRRGAVLREEVDDMEESASKRRSFDISEILSDETISSVPVETVVLEYGRRSSDQLLSEGSVPSRQSKLETKSPSENLDNSDRMDVPEKSGHNSGLSVSGAKMNRTVWTCDRCGVQIRGKKGNLNRHIANKHEHIRAFECKVANCGRRFQTRLNLVRHDTAVHKGRPHSCGSCPRAFKYEKDLIAHVKSAHQGSEGQLACAVCGSCFGRRSTLNRHMAKVHKLGTEAAAAVT